MTDGREPSTSHLLVPSDFGALRILWQETETGPKVSRVFLPGQQAMLGQDAQLASTGVNRSPRPSIAKLTQQIGWFLKGDTVEFDLGLLAFEQCSEFQRSVLLAERQIPRGWVSTYGRIARNLGVPRGARAVGGALARNPFPIIIPCHRAIRSDGRLGGFQGGLEMKRALLRMEGVEVGPAGRVLSAQVFY